jgi:predicted membrane channel-forming protein YqfA (hemolysin III family)
MTGTIPRSLRIALWVIGGVLAVMAVLNLLYAWHTQSADWWLTFPFLVSAGVCLTIAAASHRTAAAASRPAD